MQQDHGDRDRAPVGAGVPAVPVYAGVEVEVRARALALGARVLGPVMAAVSVVAVMDPEALALSGRGRLRPALSPMTRRPSEPRQPSLKSELEAVQKRLQELEGNQP